MLMVLNLQSVIAAQKLMIDKLIRMQIMIEEWSRDSRLNEGPSLRDLTSLNSLDVYFDVIVLNI